jgi:hypothetical protein
MAQPRTLVLLYVFGLLVAHPLDAQEPKIIGDAHFNQLHTLIKPQSGESRWMEVDWYPSIWEARQVAAKEGKPLFIMAGSGGAPAAGC